MKRINMENTTNKISKNRSKAYPAYSLNEALNFLEKFIDYPMHRPISIETASKEIGINSKTKSFTYKISTAKQFGLITIIKGTGFCITEIGYKIIRPTEPEEEIQKYKINCFKLPPLYEKLISDYNGKSIPTSKIFENILMNNYGITPNVANLVASKFIETANELGVILNGILDLENPIKSNNKETNENLVSDANNVDTNLEKEEADALGEDSKLVIPMNNNRSAKLIMPQNVEKKEAEYVLQMINIMFKQLYDLN